MKLSIAIKRLRQHLGLRQTDFAQRLGISIQTVNRYENNSRIPSVAVIFRLQVLATESGEMDLADVFNRYGNPAQQMEDALAPNFAALALPQIDTDLVLVLMVLTKSVCEPTISENQRKDLVSEAVLKLMQCREFIETTQSFIAGTR